MSQNVNWHFDLVYFCGFNGVEKENDLYGENNAYSFEYRIHDPRIGRFLSVDPLFALYPWNSPYAFAENNVIMCVDLEGLESSIAIAGKGNGSNYKPGDEAEFLRGANRIKQADGTFQVLQVSTGQELLKVLTNATTSHGWVQNVVTFAHSGSAGLSLNWNAGFYVPGMPYNSTGYASTGDLAKLVENGSIKFGRTATWILASCNTAGLGLGDQSSIAFKIADELGVTTIGSTGLSNWECDEKGQSTGYLKTVGTWMKYEKQFILTYDNVEGQQDVRTFKKQSEAEAYNRGFNSDGKYTYNIKEVNTVTDLGDRINASEYATQP